MPAEADNTFVLAMADATAAELVPRLVEIIEAEAPGVSLRVVPLATRDPRKLLDEETIDLAVGYFPAALADLTARAQVGKAVMATSTQDYNGKVSSESLIVVCTRRTTASQELRRATLGCSYTTSNCKY